jgi:hypothetical protein
MPKSTKPNEKVPGKSKSAKPRRYYALHPWRCEHSADHSKIQAYSDASGKWEIVAIIPPTPGLTPETLAEFIANIINANQKNQDLLRSAMKALEDVIEEGITFSTEQAADSVIAQIKKQV